ncbi:ATP-binding protein, partial [Staphylococcus shinii]
RNMLGISIKDEGIGIKQVHLKYIFDRTYRVDNSRNKETGGSGLGLYIASTLAKQIGGGISVDSKFEEGTTMTVYFPIN